MIAPTPVLTIKSAKGGVGTTSIVFHLAWMLAELGKTVVAVDLDPQTNLTQQFLSDPDLQELWGKRGTSAHDSTAYRCIAPLKCGRDILSPATRRVGSHLHLVPGDLMLADLEDDLSREWSFANQPQLSERSIRFFSSYWQLAQLAARKCNADLVLFDVGPAMGAGARTALVASDHVVLSLADDIFLGQSLSILGRYIRTWRSQWRKILDVHPPNEAPMPDGNMLPAGYVLVQQSAFLVRKTRRVESEQDINDAYRANMLEGTYSRQNDTEDDCLARVKNYLSLFPVAHEQRKPIFQLTPADGAVGSHAYAVRDARNDFHQLAERIMLRMGIDRLPETSP